MNLTDERRKAMYANKFNKARKQGFKSFNYWNKEIIPNATPQERLDDSVKIRKSIMDQALITKEEKDLANKSKYHSKKRTDVAFHGVKRSSHAIGGIHGNETQRMRKGYAHHNERDRQATADLAKLQGRKLNDSYDKYM